MISSLVAIAVIGVDDIAGAQRSDARQQIYQPSSTPLNDMPRQPFRH
jgi:hypothetical protein